MRRKDVKTIIAYYFEIPDMQKGFTAERARLESEYDGLRGTSYDGIPHSSTPGKPTEELAAKMEANNTWGRSGGLSQNFPLPSAEICGIIIK